MYEEFTQDRIVKLRMQKGVSARDMSLSLGQNPNYINRIENKRALTSLQGLFYICEYLGVTPSEFFDEGSACPARLKEVMADLKRLDAGALELVGNLAKELLKNR